MDHRILEELTRIANALEDRNKIEQEIFDFNKQIMTDDIAQQVVNQELSQKSSPRETVYSLGSIRDGISKSIGAI
jgi:hypothetical protein